MFSHFCRAVIEKEKEKHTNLHIRDRTEKHIDTCLHIRGVVERETHKLTHSHIRGVIERETNKHTHLHI